MFELRLVIHKQDKWRLSVADSKNPSLFEGIKFYAENHLQLENVVSARVGRQIRELPAALGYDKAIVLTWTPYDNMHHILETMAERDKVHKVKLNTDDNWEELCVLQILMSHQRTKPQAC